MTDFLERQRRQSPRHPHLHPHLCAQSCFPGSIDPSFPPHWADDPAASCHVLRMVLKKALTHCPLPSTEKQNIALSSASSEGPKILVNRLSVCRGLAIHTMVMHIRSIQSSCKSTTVNDTGIHISVCSYLN